MHSPSLEEGKDRRIIKDFTLLGVIMAGNRRDKDAYGIPYHISDVEIMTLKASLVAHGEGSGREGQEGEGVQGREHVSYGTAYSQVCR